MVSIKTSFVVLAVAALTCTGALSANAATPAIVGSLPAWYTPWLSSSTPNQYVRQIAECGGTMYAVGNITAIEQGSSSYTRGNAFSFSPETGAVTSWDPQVNGMVHAIAFSPDCSVAYLGGTFTEAGGAPAQNLAAVSTSTGQLVSSFAHSAGSEVDTLVLTHGSLLVGGTFTTINGTARTKLASLDPTTGAVTSYADLAITGSYPGATTWTRIYSAQLNNAGDRLLVEGVFTSIGGVARQQIAVLDLDGSSVSVDHWYAKEFNQACSVNVPFYARAATWSPNDKRIYVAATGVKPSTGAGSRRDQPRAGLCDAASAFSAKPGKVSHLWINYTGCDSYYSIAADAKTVYVSGHERWANNPDACDAAGTGALDRPGIAALSASDGAPTAWNPTRSLGHGSVDLLLTTDGLWVASDNYTNGLAQDCGGQGDHGGICLLPTVP